MRLVERTQRQLQAVRPVDEPGRLSMREVAELEARVRTLRRLGHSFNHVALSRYIAHGDARGVLGGVGGECVATEV